MKTNSKSIFLFISLLIFVLVYFYNENRNANILEKERIEDIKKDSIKQRKINNKKSFDDLSKMF